MSFLEKAPTALLQSLGRVYLPRMPRRLRLVRYDIDLDIILIVRYGQHRSFGLGFFGGTATGEDVYFGSGSRSMADYGVKCREARRARVA